MSWRRHLWWYGFRWAAKLRLAAAAAALLGLAIEKPGKSGSGDGARLLILAKQGLSEDADSAFGDDPRFVLWHLDMVEIKLFKAMVSAFLPPEIDDYNYISDDPAIAADKAAYRAFAKQVMARLLAKFGFAAVITANFAYYAEREVGAALEQLGVPFIVLDKEGRKSPGRAEFFREIYRRRRGPFAGRRILACNDIEKSILLDAGIVTPERLTVTGMPRFDRIHRWRRRVAGRRREGQAPRQVLFFSFSAKSGLPRIARKLGFGVPGGLEPFADERDDWNWDELLAACHRAAVTLARENPEIHVVVKSKGTSVEVRAMEASIAAAGPRPDNLVTVAGGDPLELILQSDAVFGFNSTALFEALAAGKPLVVPRFAEAGNATLQPHIIDLEEAAEYAFSEAELVDLLRAHAIDPAPAPAELPVSHAALLQKWTGNADGCAGQRVAAAVLAEIRAKHD
ncbi:MAG TPA: hypothetical protein QF861_08135 [Alphaproteobacteria bacterium]|nr:hypothetical protein [Alphaproteobacteria bacterium]